MLSGSVVVRVGLGGEAGAARDAGCGWGNGTAGEDEDGAVGLGSAEGGQEVLKEGAGKAREPKRGNWGEDGVEVCAPKGVHEEVHVLEMDEVGGGVATCAGVPRPPHPPQSPLLQGRKSVRVVPWGLAVEVVEVG
jgi:hypothetical protein